MSRQIRIDRQIMTRICRGDERAAAHAQQIVFAHHPQYALVIDIEIAPPQLRRNAAIPITRRLQGNLLHFIAQF